MKRFTTRHPISVLYASILYASGMLGMSSQAIASGFQLWDQDGASIGNYHAGYAALAKDASTAFYNPAGITRIKNQQLVFGAVEITSNLKYNGTIAVNTLNGNAPQSVTAQGGASAFVPDLHYVAPISDSIGFGFSVDAPFGSKVDYGRRTFIRYASVRAAVSVVDISPSLGFQITDKFSLGVGVDVQQIKAQFDQVGVSGDNSDTDSTTKGDGTGYGLHLGGLYQFTPCTRIGLSYHSQVVHHLSGTSKFVGTLADLFNGGPIISQHARTNITLPAYTALSMYHQLHPKLALMGSVIYTQWGILNNLILQDLAGLQGFAPSTNVIVSIPEHFRNSWNVSFGADYYLTDNITLRGGVGYDQTPTNDSYRNVQLPDNNRYAVALGGHYQASKVLGFDLSWTHLFVPSARISPPSQVTGDQIVTTQQITRKGSSMGGANVFGVQMTWDIV